MKTDEPIFSGLTANELSNRLSVHERLECVAPEFSRRIKDWGISINPRDYSNSSAQDELTNQNNKYKEFGLRIEISDLSVQNPNFQFLIELKCTKSEIS